MFKNIDQWSQSKLKSTSNICNILYFAITYFAPVLTVFIMFWSNSSVQQYRITFTMILILAVILAVSSKLITKRIDKISVLNIDGTYNKGLQLFKHVCQAISKAILPIAVLIVAIAAKTIFVDKIVFFCNLLIWVAVFYLIGALFDKMIISELDEEVELRLEVAK